MILRVTGRSHPSRRRFLAAAAAAAGGSCVVGWTKNRAAEAGTAHIAAWNQAILAAVKASASSPCQASRSLAIIHAAALDAFQSERKQPTLLALTLPLAGRGAARESSAVACMASACFSAAASLFPTQRPVFEALLSRQFETVPEGLRSRAREAGAAWAQAHLDSRAGDGASSNITYVPVLKPGHWRRTPPRFRPPELPHWRQLQPFTFKTSGQFRPEPPPELASPEYLAGWSRVRDIGSAGSTLRTAEQTLIAKFWSCFSYTITPAGHWPAILGDLAVRKSIPAEQAVRAYALLAMATADAAIAAWDAKYTYEFWRPVHAIPMADSDGNAATGPVAGWQPLLETPPHPEYVSGHSAMGQAGTDVMKHLFSGDSHAFDAHSDTVSDSTRHFTSFQACADEMSLSRVLGGIHFPFSSVAGQVLGRATSAQSIKWMHDRLGS